MINDDLMAFGDWARAMGQAAAETEAAVLASLLTANSGDGVSMDDGDPLYNTTFGNKAASGGAISVTTLGAARMAMRTVVGLDGETPVGVPPRYILVGPAKETEAEQVLAAIYAAAPDDVNPFSGKLQLLVEPRLTGNAWRLFADPAAAPVIEFAHLSDAPGPQIDMKEGWNVLGIEIRCVLDFGAGAIGRVGTYLNPGN